MRRLLLVVAATTGATIAFLVFSDGTVEVLGIWVLLAIILGTGLSRDRRAPRPAPPPPPSRPRRSDHLPPRLADLERMLAFSQTLRSDFDRRVVPRLRTIADTRLRADHGLSLDDPRAATLLGDDAWRTLRTDRPDGDAMGAGVSLGEMTALVGAIERLGTPS